MSKIEFSFLKPDGTRYTQTLDIAGGDIPPATGARQPAMMDATPADPRVQIDLATGLISIGGVPFNKPLIHSATVTLTDDQIKALPGAPIEIVAALGAGKLISFISGWLSFDFISAYTNVTDPTASDIVVAYDNNTYNASNPRAASIVFSQTGALVTPLFTDANALGGSVFAINLANKNLVIAADNVGGDFTGGDPLNTLKVTVLYSVLDV